MLAYSIALRLALLGCNARQLKATEHFWNRYQASLCSGQQSARQVGGQRLQQISILSFVFKALAACVCFAGGAVQICCVLIIVLFFSPTIRELEFHIC